MAPAGGAPHLEDSADEHIVALVVDSVSHQNFVHHWNENLVLEQEREEIRNHCSREWRVAARVSPH